MTEEVGTISMKVAAEALGVSRRHIERLVQRGEGPPVVRLGRRRLIRRSAFSAWLAERETTAG